jgi:putative endonuclease
MFYTYMVRCKDGTLYTGYTNDVKSRIEAHNEGKGAKYTRGRLPVTLVYVESFADKSQAMKREYEIKQYPRAKKEKLIKNWKQN